MKQKEQKEEKINTCCENMECSDEGLQSDVNISSECSCDEQNPEAPSELNESNTDEQKELDELRRKLDEKTKECEENFNRFLRMQADFDNYKKRVAREREELFYTSLEAVVKELLPVVDNLERAVGAFRNDNLDSKYVDGVDMVCKQLIGVLEKNGVKEIESIDKEFDPNLHHAVMQVDGDEDQENKVTEVFQKGYTLGSKVVRPSMVKVAVRN